MTVPTTARPIEDWERPLLEAVGARLKQVRLAIGLSQGDLGPSCGIPRTMVGRIERGVVRTRASVLARLVKELAEADHEKVPDPDALTAELVQLAGSTLVPRSASHDRIERRRDRRANRYLKHIANGLSMDEAWWRSATRGWREY